MPLYYILTYATSMVIANNEAQARAKWENNEEFGLEADVDGSIITIIREDAISEEEALLIQEHHRNQPVPEPYRSPPSS